jgi:hypothetical protein
MTVGIYIHAVLAYKKQKVSLKRNKGESEQKSREERSGKGA